ncbi:hypothetical protein [Kitasatospora sp. NPDC059571]|uniref:hypothetical protein n=1 Tax=Kitasatospora sp. NPDC059571 TaxID=3346871 RepID=UPI0036794E72
MTAASGGGERIPFDAEPAPGQPAAPPYPQAPPPMPSTGWTSTMPAITLPPPPAAAAAPPVAAGAAQPPLRGMGAGLRGRILVVEGGYGQAGRRPWGRGQTQAPVLSTMLAAVPPHILLAADAVDAVHLPGAGDPQTVLAHLRAAARHPGPLLVHLGGHLVTDRRAEQLFLTLRDTRSHETLPWQAVAAELRHRPQDWDTLVVGDLSADPAAWPLVQSTISPLTDGVPLWAVVNPDPDQVGTFTRALIEVLHVGVPGAGPLLAPEQVRGQVHSVLRPDAVLLTTHAPDRRVFRNTSRQAGDPSTEMRLSESPRPAAVLPRPPARTARPKASAAARVTLAKPLAAPAPAPSGPRGPVSLLKPGVPPTPPRPPRPVSLRKTGAGLSGAEPSGADLPGAGLPDTTLSIADLPRVELGKGAPNPFDGPAPSAAPGPFDAPQHAPGPFDAPAPPAAAGPTVDLAKPAALSGTGGPAGPSADPLAAYREAVGRIVRAADAGDHDTAADLALGLEAEVLEAHGPADPQVLQVRQVRAHVSRLAGRAVLAAALYREVAIALLGTLGADDPETQRAATNAEACWRAVTDRTEAIRIAPEIIELRAHLPGPDGRKLRAAERYLDRLAAAPAEV